MTVSVETDSSRDEDPLVWTLWTPLGKDQKEGEGYTRSRMLSRTAVPSVHLGRKTKSR